MYSRHVSMHLKPNSRVEFTQALEKEIIPILRKQKGFQDEITFLAPGAGTEVVAISLWEQRENAEAYHRGAYPEVLKTLARVVDGTPEVRNFEVATSTFDKVAVAAGSS
jgi:quinol monooxygenase YgiN